ncbi:MAG: DUF6513 domain-containing protein, partial [Nitrososphaerota archaeon]
MNVLLVTGRLAKGLVEKYSKESKVEAEVISLPVPVAALMSTNYIARELKLRSPLSYDLILVPGLSFGDTHIIEKEVGIPTFKGPKYAADLPFVLNLLDRVQLSKTLPACEVIKSLQAKKDEEELKSLNVEQELQRPGNVLVRSLPIGKGFPIRVMAEIHDVPAKSDDEIRRLAEYFLRCGGEIIDIGMMSGESHPEDAER